METSVARYYAANSLETQGNSLGITVFGGSHGMRWDDGVNGNNVYIWNARA